MITETGRVVAIEKDCLWVETIQQSACDSCAAQKGCGQRMMARMGGRTTYIRVLLQGKNPAQYQLDDQVQIGIQEEVVAKGSLIVYMVPLLGLVSGTVLGHGWNQTEWLSAIGGLAGFALGGLIVWIHSYMTRNDENLQPVLLGGEAPVRFVAQAEQV